MAKKRSKDSINVGGIWAHISATGRAAIIIAFAIAFVSLYYII